MDRYRQKTDGTCKYYDLQMGYGIPNTRKRSGAETAFIYSQLCSPYGAPIYRIINSLVPLAAGAYQTFLGHPFELQRPHTASDIPPLHTRTRDTVGS